LASASAFNVTLVLVLGCEAGIHASNLVGQALVIANGKLKFAESASFRGIISRKRNGMMVLLRFFGIMRRFSEFFCIFAAEITELIR
jgi:hypothetical protein